MYWYEIIKVNKNDKREIQCEAGKWMQTLYNNINLKPKWEDYNLDIGYYSKAIESEIDNILSVHMDQLKLF